MNPRVQHLIFTVLLLLLSYHSDGQTNNSLNKIIVNKTIEVSSNLAFQDSIDAVGKTFFIQNSLLLNEWNNIKSEIFSSHPDITHFSILYFYYALHNEQFMIITCKSSEAVYYYKVNVISFEPKLVGITQIDHIRTIADDLISICEDYGPDLMATVKFNTKSIDPTFVNVDNTASPTKFGIILKILDFLSLK